VGESAGPLQSEDGGECANGAFGEFLSDVVHCGFLGLGFDGICARV
jgi:hypothetical protein